jgi:hypothetical protein
VTAAVIAGSNDQIAAAEISALLRISRGAAVSAAIA